MSKEDQQKLKEYGKYYRDVKRIDFKITLREKYIYIFFLYIYILMNRWTFTNEFFHFSLVSSLHIIKKKPERKININQNKDFQ